MLNVNEYWLLKRLKQIKDEMEKNKKLSYKIVIDFLKDLNKRPIESSLFAAFLDITSDESEIGQLVRVIESKACKHSDPWPKTISKFDDIMDTCFNSDKNSLHEMFLSFKMKYKTKYLKEIRNFDDVDLSQELKSPEIVVKKFNPENLFVR